LIPSARPSAPNLSARTPRITDRLESWGAAFLFGIFRVLPLDCGSAFGGALARGIGPLLPVTRHARRNINRAFPGLSESEIEGVIGSMWDNLGRLAAEYPHLRKIRVFEPGGRVETHGLEHVDRAVKAGRRMIVFSGHIANWEIAMLAGVQYGISVAQIYRAGNNPLLDRMITRFRGHGGELIPKGAVAAGRAIEALRCGTHAPAYSARRSATAKKLGLGRRRQIVKETPRRRSRSKARTASATS
jgi:KDO2-lipid IV(A) lauroyltransferase